MRWHYHIPASAVALALLFSAVAVSDGVDTTSSDEKALQAAKLKTDGPALLEFLRGRIIADVDAGKIRKLIKELGSDTFDVRENATDELIRLGSQAAPLLQQA